MLERVSHALLFRYLSFVVLSVHACIYIVCIHVYVAYPCMDKFAYLYAANVFQHSIHSFTSNFANVIGSSNVLLTNIFILHASRHSIQTPSNVHMCGSFFSPSSSSSYSLSHGTCESFQTHTLPPPAQFLHLPHACEQLTKR